MTEINYTGSGTPARVVTHLLSRAREWNLTFGLSYAGDWAKAEPPGRAEKETSRCEWELIIPRARIFNDSLPYRQFGSRAVSPLRVPELSQNPHADQETET